MTILVPSATPASVLWLDWAERLQIRLRECPTILIADELRECAIRFYRDGRMWRETGIALATTVAAQAAYTVTVPAYAQLAGLPAIWIDDVEVDEASPGSLDDATPDETGTILRVGVTGPAQITLSPIPDAAGQVVTGTVAYCPSADSTGIYETLYFNHRDSIEAMALERMMSQPEKPWTNLVLSSKHDGDATVGTLYNSTMAGPVRRTRIRTRMQRI